MRLRKRLEAGLILAVAAMLCACTTSPRSDFSWNLKDSRPHKPRVVVAYGPHAVTLPPVERQLATPQYATPKQQQTQTRVATATPTPTQKPRRTPGWYTPSPSPQQTQTASRDESRVAVDNSVSFQWPVKGGRIVSGFGTSGDGQRNDGINIAVSNGTPVRAAASGTVSYCGNELKGFGNLVLIRHDNGYITAYAHVANIVVNRGDRVLGGQVIATSGATGDVAAPQLHFEIRGANQRPVNPTAYLPRTTQVAANS